MQAEKPSERELPTPFRKQGQQIQADGEVVATCDLWCREQVEAAIDAALSHPSTPQGWKQIGWTCGDGDCGRIHESPGADGSYAVPVYVPAPHTKETSP